MNNSRHLSASVFLLVLAAALMGFLPSCASAAPSVTIYTDSDRYSPGDLITVSLSGRNFDYGMSVDIYIGLLTPGGGVYTLVWSGWTEYLEPWVRDIYIPNPFDMPRTDFMWYGVPCAMPPIHAPLSRGSRNSRLDYLGQGTGCVILLWFPGRAGTTEVVNGCHQVVIPWPITFK